MLEHLHIQNIAVIDETAVSFDGGFHVLTGETGAGKSILIDSINMVLGERTSRDLIRSGEKKAYVEALFTLSESTVQQLAEWDITDTELLISREMTADGKNTCRINGRLATTAILREIARHVINIHGQHDNQSLLDPTAHIDFLDRYAMLEEELFAYREIYEKTKAVKEELESLQMDETEKERTIDLLTHQIQEIESAKWKEGEEDSLIERRKLLSGADGILKTLSHAQQQLYESEYGDSLYDAVSRINSELSHYTSLDSSLEELYGRLDNILIEIDDVVHQMRSYMDELEYDPGELDRLEQRLDLIHQLQRKYGKDVAGELEKMKEELSGIMLSDERMLQLSAELKKLTAERDEKAEALSAKRKEAAVALAEKISGELADLDMKKVRFEVDITPKNPGEKGIDKVEFMISTNPGEPLKPLSKIASGGELSRIMLAVKSILSDSDEVDTLIFDEIDTGVSGRAAQKIAEKIHKISKSKQVICITHLAAIAAMADSHYLIEKKVSDERTQTSVYPLEPDERERELARMIGGVQVTDLTMQTAGEMLKMAEEFKNGKNR